MRLASVVWWVWLLIVVAIISAPLAFGAPVAQARVQEVTITLFDDPCVLPAVSNLKQRATWTEAGKVYQGCWGSHALGIIMVYFDDRTIGALPVQAFTRIQVVQS